MHSHRALWVALGVLGLACAAYFLHESGPRGMPWYLHCWYRRITGLYCPGCGMTRAAYAAVHGRIGEAFRMNPLGMVILPVAGMVFAYQLLGWVRGRPLGENFRLGKEWGRVLIGVVVVFWVLRNVPYWPFTYLAPF